MYLRGSVVTERSNHWEETRQVQSRDPIVWEVSSRRVYQVHRIQTTRTGVSDFDRLKHYCLAFLSVCFGGRV